MNYTETGTAASPLDEHLNPDPELIAAFLMLLDNPNGVASLREAVRKRNWAVVHRDTLAALEKQIAQKVNSKRDYWELQAAAKLSNEIAASTAQSPKLPYLPK
jgi:hypothetical protein